MLNEATASDDVVRLRLVKGKITLVHRRLWPALARLADRLGPEALAAVHQEHTTSGTHRSRTIPFPEWVPAPVLHEAARLSEAEAVEHPPDGILDGGPARPGTGMVASRRADGHGDRRPI